MVHIVGAGSGAPDLITLRGAELLRKAQVVIYAGSLVNPSLLGLCGPDCRLYNSAHLTLEEVLEIIRQATEQNQDVVRLHTGDPCLFGAIREQTDALDALGILGHLGAKGREQLVFQRHHPLGGRQDLVFQIL